MVTHDIGPFRIRMPQRWQLTSFVLTPGDAVPGRGGVVNVLLSREPVETGTTLGQYMKALQEQIRDSGIQVSPSKKPPRPRRTEGGHQAMVTEFRIDGPAGESLTQIAQVQIVGDSAYILTSTFPDGADTDAARDEVEGILASFAIAPPPGA